MDTSWDTMFIRMAKVIAGKSKDPRTQVGAILVSPDKNKISIGFNGLPAGLIETKKRWEDKYSYVIHAELNAILNAKTDLCGWTLYTTMFPCANCRNSILQSKISRIVYLDDAVAVRENTIEESKALFQEREVAIERYRNSWNF